MNPIPYLSLTVFLLVIFISLPNSQSKNLSEGAGYSAEEVRVVEKFRSLVGDLLTEDYMKTDHYLIRWVRDKNLNVYEAEKKFRNYLHYRKANKIDNIINEDMSELRKQFPFYIDGYDVDGRPVLTWPYGSSWDVRKAALSGQTQKLLRYLDYMIETTAVAARKSKSKSGQSLSQAVGIMDLNGYNIRQHACLLCLPFYGELIAKLENNYPQALKSFNIINTPRIFSRLLETVLPLASPATRSVVHVYGHDRNEWQAFMKTIPSDQLTQQFGGTKIRA